MVPRYEGYRSGAVPKRERVYPPGSAGHAETLASVSCFQPLGTTWEMEARAVAGAAWRHPRVGPRLNGFAAALAQVAMDHAYHNWEDLPDHPDDEDEGLSLWSEVEEGAYQDHQRGMAELAVAILGLVSLEEREGMQARLPALAT